MHTVKRFVQSLSLSLSLLAAGGCVVDDEDQTGTEDPLVEGEEEMVSTLEDYAEGEDVPYGYYCQMYGDCAYCESRDWSYGQRCVRVCYGWYCYNGADSGSGCYWDCNYIC